MIDNAPIQSLITRHLRFLVKTNFQGWDVLDGLNSDLFQKLPWHDNKWFRLFWIQLFRRSPINFRTIARVPKQYNPKALALFISALLRLSLQNKSESYRSQALALYDKLIQVKSRNYSGLSWGYNFDWQARAFNVPKFKPNMVCSVFGGHAVLDLYDHTSDEIYLSHARQVAQFIMENLVLIDESNRLCFGYIPGEPAVIHNVNLLGAAFLARLANITGEQAFAAHAQKAVKFSAENQRSDGAWVYGDQSHHQWVDNFHTGYILVALHQYQQFCRDDQFQENLINGVEFHLKNHFTENMLPKYSDQKRYPLDVHCFSQALITFHTLQSWIPDYQKGLAQLLKNVIDLLWDKEHHFFYYKKSWFFKSKIPYVRWAQAWMFYSLTLLLDTADE